MNPACTCVNGQTQLRTLVDASTDSVPGFENRYLKSGGVEQRGGSKAAYTGSNHTDSPRMLL